MSFQILTIYCYKFTKRVFERETLDNMLLVNLTTRDSSKAANASACEGFSPLGSLFLGQPDCTADSWQDASDFPGSDVQLRTVSSAL